jgi:pyruvate kinase
MWERDPVLHEALQRRGAVTAIAQAAGISTAAVSQWRKVPAWWVLTVAEVTGYSPHELRPDLYPAPMRRPHTVAARDEGVNQELS